MLSEVGFYRVDLSYIEEDTFKERNGACLVVANDIVEVAQQLGEYFGKDNITFTVIRLIAWHDCSVIDTDDDSFDWEAFKDGINLMYEAYKDETYNCE